MGFIQHVLFNSGLHNAGWLRYVAKVNLLLPLSFSIILIYIYIFIYCRSAPFRTFTAMWWIIAVIIPNSYTANLAAFLTSSKMEYTVSSLKSLVEQVNIKFGTIEGGSTYTLFAESNETVYRLAYNMMNNEDPSVYTKSNNEGVERVLKNNGSYMFLMETTSLEYNIERHCKLRMVGDKFGEKHYAIAVPFGKCCWN